MNGYFRCGIDGHHLVATKTAEAALGWAQIVLRNRVENRGPDETLREITIEWMDGEEWPTEEIIPFGANAAMKGKE